MLGFFARKKAERLIEQIGTNAIQQAQSGNIAALSDYELYKAAEQLCGKKQKNFLEARPYLDELLKRDHEDDRFKSNWTRWAAQTYFWDEPVDYDKAQKAALYRYKAETWEGFEEYILGFYPKYLDTGDFNFITIPPTALYTPDMDALGKRLSAYVLKNKQGNDKCDAKGNSEYKLYYSVFFMEEYYHLQRVGYEHVARTPEAVCSFFYDLAKKGDPTGQYWLSVCYEREIVPQEKRIEGDWRLQAALQGYPIAVERVDLRKQSDDIRKTIEDFKKQVHARADEYLSAVTETTVSPMTQFMARRKAEQAAAEELADRTAKRDKLYQQAVMAYALGQQEQALADMAQAAEWGHDGAYLWLVGRAAEQGSAQAQYQMGEYSLTGTASTPKNTTAAFEWLAKAASGGVADAFWRLGELYHHGADGFAANREMAVSMYQKAAEGESLPGMLAYGDFCAPAEAKALYRKVVNTERTDLAARAYIMEGWRKLATVDPEDFATSLEGAAHFTLLYFDPGKNLGYTAKKPADAVKAALSGDGKMARELGSVLAYNYEDVAKDIADREKIARVWWMLAVSHYTALVDKGDPDARRTLFYIYHEDLRDDYTARQWGCSALWEGDITMYYVAAVNPKVFDLSDSQAIDYLSIAAANGDEGARNELEYRQRQIQSEAARQRWVEQVRRQQDAARQATREREVDEAIAAKLDSAERLVNTLAYGEMFTDEERALMGKVSQMDAIRSASLRDDIIREMKKKLN